MKVIAEVVVIGVMLGILVWQGTVAERYRAERSIATERLQRVIAGSPVAIVMCDRKQRISEYNFQAEKFLGWKRAEIIGKSINTLISPDFKEEHDRHYAAAVTMLEKADEPWEITKYGIKTTAICKSGREVPVVLSVRGIRYNGNIEFVAVVRDPKAPPLEGGPFPKSKP